MIYVIEWKTLKKTMIDAFEYTNCIEILRISLKLSQDELYNLKKFIGRKEYFKIKLFGFREEHICQPLKKNMIIRKLQ